MQTATRLLAPTTLLAALALVPGCAEDVAPNAAIAVDDTTVDVGVPIALDAVASSDPQGDALTYRWSLEDAPADSQATIEDPDAVQTSFTPDVEGDYTVQLRVSDGEHEDRLTRTWTAVPVACGEPARIVTDSVDKATTWSPGPIEGCVDVRVDEPIDVDEDLTIEAGTTVAMAAGAALEINGEASLTARGTDTEPIRILGTEEVKGHWEALVFDSNNPENVLENVEILHGGRGADFSVSGEIPASIIVRQQGQVGLLDSTIRDGQGHGLWLEEGTLLAEFNDNIIADLAGSPLRIPSNLLRRLDPGSDYDGDSLDETHTEPYIDVVPSTIDTEGTWPAIDLPYRLSGKHDVQMSDVTDTLVVEPGVTLELADGAGIRVDDGAFNAVGTADEPITIEGVVATPGYWEALVFGSNNPGNELRHVVISHGGKGDDFSFSGQIPALIIVRANSQLTLSDAILSDSGDLCWSVDEEASFTTSDVTTTGCL